MNPLKPLYPVYISVNRKEYRIYVVEDYRLKTIVNKPEFLVKLVEKMNYKKVTKHSLI